jgi:carbonic anhydrase/acetyltransferase-like protein (isoleucine patch superfamily)
VQSPSRQCVSMTILRLFPVGILETMIRAFRGTVPKVAASSYIDPSAQVIGDVVLGERCSVWPNATLRGDVNSIRIGDDSNVQDNSVLHVDSDGFPLHIGDRVTVGHSVVLHGCTVEDECVIGIGATVLNGAKVGKGSVVAAAALVPEGMEIPPGSMVMGVPGKVRREVTPAEQERFRENAAHYVELREHYMDSKE